MSKNKYASKKNVMRRHQLLTTWRDWTTEERLSQLKGWARSGLTDADIARKIGIKRTTIYSWKKKSADIADALKKGKEVVDFDVENSLLDRALGKCKSTTTVYKMVKLDDDVLKAKRFKARQEYQMDHPEATKAEIMAEVLLRVPTWEKIPIEVIEKNTLPDTTAAIFWLKARKPEVFRDQAFQKLNKAQAEKALAEVDKVKAETEVKQQQAQIIAGEDSSVEFVDDVPAADNPEKEGSEIIHADKKPEREPPAKDKD